MSDICIRDLSISFSTNSQATPIIKHMNVDFFQNQITAIVGESGSGKSILGLSILGLLPKSANIKGRCLYKNKNLYALKEKDLRSLRSKEISLILQNPSSALNPVRSLGKQLLEAPRQRGLLSKKQAREKSAKFLKDFGFALPEQIFKSFSFQMSGGMNQRILSVMGLLGSPQWIIADEPTKGLDSILRKNISETLLRLRHNYKKSIILITHDLHFAGKIADDIVVFYKGHLVERQPAEKIFSAPKHPYTQMLLRALPENGLQRPQSPDPIENPSPCPFFSQCPKRESLCKTQINETITFSSRSLVRCHFHDKN